MLPSSSHDVTALLVAWGQGDQTALDQLAPLIHAELYRLAKGYMRREGPNHPLQTSALINEAYVRLIDWKSARFENRAHFFGVAAQLMRRILVDVARSRPRTSAGVPAQNVSLDAAFDPIGTGSRSGGVGRSFERPGTNGSTQSQDCYCDSVGLVFRRRQRSYVSEATVMREWNKAKAWLYDAVARDD
jgi:hypothetical protein